MTNAERPDAGSHSLKNLWWLAVVAILASLACKLASLGSRELWLDEMYTAYVGHLQLTDVLRFTAGDQHPPLFLVLLWGWIHTVGDTVARLRLFSVLINLAAMLCMFFVGRRMLGPRFGVLAATLFALSPILFVYALEVRSYMLLILVFVALLGLHWRVVVERADSVGLLLAYGACAALAFYVHYFALFALTGLAIHAASSPAYWRGRIKKLAIAAGFCLLLVAPHVPSLLAKRAATQTLNNARAAAYTNPDTIAYGGMSGPQGAAAGGQGMVRYAKASAVLAGFYPATSHLLFLLCAIPVAVAIAVVLFLAAFKRDPLCTLSCLVIACVELGVMGMHLAATKYALLVVPACVLALARALQYCTENMRWRTPGLVCAAWLVLVYGAGFYRQYSLPQAHPWQNVFDAVQKNYKTGDAVVFDALYAQVPFDYFGRKQDFHPLEFGFPISEYAWWDKQPCKAWGGPVITHADLDRFVGDLVARKPGTVWLVLFETAYYDPKFELQKRLGNSGVMAEIPLPFQDKEDSAPDGGLRLIRIDMNQKENSGGADPKASD